MITTENHATRRAHLRDRLAAENLDSLLVSDLVNVRYLTGFTGSNGAVSVSAQSDAATRFCTDGRYAEQAAGEVPDLERVIDRPCDIALAREASGRVGFEAHVVTVTGLRDLTGATAAGAELAPTTGMVEDLRAVKDAGEIDALRRACAIGDRALAELIEAGGIRRGRTEREVALDLDHRMRTLGATDVAFDTILAAGPNSAIPHHKPGAAELAAGDLVKIDFGAVVDGYHSDMTRTVVLGAPADWQREIYDLVIAAQRAGCDAARPGIPGPDLDAAAREVITNAGYGEQFIHSLGHGVGLQIHEAPFLMASSTAIMAADMCITVEPGVYLTGRGGVRIEDSGVIRPDSYAPLTLTTKELLVL